MAMHTVDYKIPRTGSRLFDLVMVNAAKRLCMDLPKLKYEVQEKVIYISGELNDEEFEQYEKFMTGGDAQDFNML